MIGGMHLYYPIEWVATYIVNHQVQLLYSSYRVIVQMTPGLNVPTIAIATQQEASTVQGDCSNTGDLSTPPENFQQFSSAEFDIDWCQYQVSLISKDMRHCNTVEHLLKDTSEIRTPLY